MEHCTSCDIDSPSYGKLKGTGEDVEIGASSGLSQVLTIIPLNAAAIIVLLREQLPD